MHISFRASISAFYSGVNLPTNKDDSRLYLNRMWQSNQLANLKGPLILIPVGVAGCGKSSFFQNLNGFHRISADDFRLAWLNFKTTGRSFDIAIEHRVLAEFYNKLKKMIGKKLNIYVDRTNLTLMVRQRIYQLLSNDYKVLLVYFEVDVGELNKRDKFRKKPVGLAEIQRQSLILEPPNVDEGDFIYHIDGPKQLRVAPITLRK